MASSFMLRPFLPSDLPTVELWLREYVHEHRAWWSHAYGTAPVSPLQDVVAAESADLVENATSAGYLVRVLASTADTPVGIVVARMQLDRFLGLQIGTLSWIYVDPDARGSGASARLMDAAESWFVERDAAGRMVYVTAANMHAVRLYERHGYQVGDHRMLKAR